jgi:hypothetical protein
LSYNGDGRVSTKKHVYSQKYGKKILKVFGQPYFGLEDIDKCGTITISLPYSIMDILDRYTESEEISKSRYIRLLIEKDLGISYNV